MIATTAMMAITWQPREASAQESARPVAAVSSPRSILWQEHFDHTPLGWIDPFDHASSLLSSVYAIHREGDRSWLHARHDTSAKPRPPAMHFGRAFQRDPPPLDRVGALRWRWRAVRHPAPSGDAWEDLAAGVYVIIKTPTLLTGGRGFKFGWLQRVGPADTHQHGLLQVPLRADPSVGTWRSESVDLCRMFRQEYGRDCAGEHVLYVGVVTDADGTKSVAEADYADFELVSTP